MQKEVLFFDNNAPYTLKDKGGVFNKIIILEGVTKVLGGNKPDLDVTSYDLSGDSCWSIWTIRKSYDIFDLEQNRFLQFSREDFLDKIKIFYPDDFMFFVWNPGIFDGIYSETTDPEPETQSISQNGE